MGIPQRMLLLGLPGVILLGIAIGLLFFGELSFYEVAILAVMLTATDAALGKAVIMNKSVPSRVREELNVESALREVHEPGAFSSPQRFSSLLRSSSYGGQAVMMPPSFLSDAGEAASFCYSLPLAPAGRPCGIGYLAPLGSRHALRWREITPAFVSFESLLGITVRTPRSVA